MPFKALDIANLPLVLAGPILRKVTTTSVTVWFALKEHATVSLSVLNPKTNNALAATGQAVTTTIGTNLHIVAVTANTVANAPLTPGIIYTYDIAFESGNTSKTLAIATTQAGKPADLSYGTLGRPSFCLPPDDITKLRLMHGSCRHPTGNNGPDCLALLSDLIDQAPDDPDHRPHQLIMHGDQIYADDVGGGLLMAFADAEKKLLAWSDPETLPLPVVGKPLSGDKPPSGNQLPPYTRSVWSEGAGLTSDQSSCHLFTLGEYLSMYLFVWSDVLWNTGTIPTFEELSVLASSDFANLHYKKKAKFDEKLKNDIRCSAGFASSLNKVRKALANTPTYMILDDHDVTDDLNMTPQFLQNVYAEGGLGIRVVQNAFVAYALCQHWGNCPEQFAAGQPGQKLLSLLEGVKGGAAYAAASAQIRPLLAVHTYAQMKAPPKGTVTAGQENWLSAYHDPGSLTYNYTIEGKSYQVIVTDSRTWRTFRPDPQSKGSYLSHAELLGIDQIDKQISKAPMTGNRTLIVVISTNAPPVWSIRFSAEHPSLSAQAAKRFIHDPHPDTFEAWEPGSRAFDRLVGAICARLPIQKAAPPGSAVAIDTHVGGAVLLSGDVHSSFASRLLVRGTNPLLPDFNEKEFINAVLVQCVSSSLRNQTEETINQSIEGYSYRFPRVTGYQPAPEGFAGWNTLLPGSTVGHRFGISGGLKTSITQRTFNLRAFYALASVVNIPNGEPTAVPDFKYRLDYLRSTVRNGLPINFAQNKMDPMPEAVDSTTYAARAKQFNKITSNYNQYASGSSDVTLVGYNNISELRFDGAGVFHTARWYKALAEQHDPITNELTLPNRTFPQFTTWQVSMSATNPDPAAANSVNNISDVYPFRKEASS